jgi:predicted secreted protein
VSGIRTWRTRHGDLVEVYRAGDGFRYRVTARNGEKVEQGSEPYTRVDDAAEAAARHHPVINDETEEELVEESPRQEPAREEESIDEAIAHVTDEMLAQLVPAIPAGVS